MFQTQFRVWYEMTEIQLIRGHTVYSLYNVVVLFFNPNGKYNNLIAIRCVSIKKALGLVSTDLINENQGAETLIISKMKCVWNQSVLHFLKLVTLFCFSLIFLSFPSLSPSLTSHHLDLFHVKGLPVNSEKCWMCLLYCVVQAT